MPFFRHAHHGQDGFVDAGHSFNTSFPAREPGPGSYDAHSWEEEFDSYYSTCHHPEECPQCANYEEHLAFSALSFSSHTPSDPTSPPLASSFTHGVLAGRRLQREEDEELCSRYRSRLHYAQNRHTEALRVQTSHRAEIELLRRELTAVKDRLMAVQMAYEDLAMARLDDRGYLPTFEGLGDDWGLPPRPGPSLTSTSTFDVEDADVPRVVREAQLSDGLDPGRYFVDDEDEFEAWQQLHLMEDREEVEDRFWSDFHARSFRYETFPFFF